MTPNDLEAARLAIAWAVGIMATILTFSAVGNAFQALIKVAELRERRQKYPYKQILDQMETMQ